ncbi:hypothetical protein HDV06_002103 [Boothiomyces sp. JEL0866]|nr:hypothetical protein HDV06_002103 [Boothiomyces sp. JEL0866]
MKSFAALALASAAFSQIIVTPGQPGGPDPNQVHIKSISYAGTGCPAGSVSQILSQDATTFTLLMSEFVASSGPGTGITDSRKNCQINIDLVYPQGFSYSIDSVDYRGYVQIPAGITATQKATYYISGQTQQVSSQTVFSTATDNDYHTHDEIDVAAYVWSPCGAVLPGNINTQVRLTLTNPSNPKITLANTPAQITVDSIDGNVQQIYGLKWKTCP